VPHGSIAPDVVKIAPQLDSADSSSDAHDQDSSTLHDSDLETDAQQHAGRTIAQLFAHKAATALSDRSKDEGKAKELDKFAEELRKNATTLVQSAPAEAEEAARNAATAAVKRAIAKVQDLEKLASKEEKKAKKKRREAKEAMRQALVAQANMSRLFGQLGNVSSDIHNN